MSGATMSGGDWIRMGLVADSADVSPDIVPGVVILDNHYLVRRAGMNGYLVAIEKTEYDACISALMDIGYDSYHL